MGENPAAAEERPAHSTWKQRIAAALGQLLLIMVGVLAALAVDEWNAERNDRALEREYLHRLVSDFEANLAVADNSAQWQADIARNARLVFPLIRDGTPSPHDNLSVLAQAYNATPGPTPSWVNDTFDELLSTGRFSLITNPELRAELFAYNRYLTAADYPFELRSHSYRRLIREQFDPELQLQIRRHCPRNHDRCQIPNLIADVGALVAWMRENAALARALTRVITQSSRAEHEYLQGVRTATDRVLVLLRRELAG